VRIELAVAAADLSVVSDSDGSSFLRVRSGHEIFLYSKASEAEIFIRVRRRYLTFFAGLHFEN